jgi:hypothetical protein
VSETRSLVVDVKLRRPGCALIQAAHGVRANDIIGLIDSNKWLLAPTPDMYLVEGTMDQWRGFAKECNARDL